MLFLETCGCLSFLAVASFLGHLLCFSDSQQRNVKMHLKHCWRSRGSNLAGLNHLAFIPHSDHCSNYECDVIICG